MRRATRNLHWRASHHLDRAKGRPIPRIVGSESQNSDEALRWHHEGHFVILAANNKFGAGRVVRCPPVLGALKLARELAFHQASCVVHRSLGTPRSLLPRCELGETFRSPTNFNAPATGAAKEKFRGDRFLVSRVALVRLVRSLRETRARFCPRPHRGSLGHFPRAPARKKV